MYIDELLKDVDLRMRFRAPLSEVAIQAGTSITAVTVEPCTERMRTKTTSWISQEYNHYLPRF